MRPTDFDTELERIDAELAPLRTGALDAPVDFERATRYVYTTYKRASLTGDLDALERVGADINRVVAHFRRPSDLYFLKASVAFKLHRLGEVKRCLASCAELRESPQGRVLQADLDFQEGRYDAAHKAYEELIRRDRAWDDLARLAYLKFKMGDPDAADALYAEAEDELTAKEMRHFAWVELQRGLLDLARGRHDDARAHYERADRAYTGYWVVEEHLAELCGAQGRFEEAESLYKKVVARVPRPEFKQALGELYDFTGRPADAQEWYEQAHADYLSSARRGGVHYYHHLVDFYADVLRDGAEAVRWARKDLELRDNFATRAALAWALYRDNRPDEALEEMSRALASGAEDAHLLRQAATVYKAAGRADEADNFSRRAARINPHHSGFHVHR